jgi:hypothetical protein
MKMSQPFFPPAKELMVVFGKAYPMLARRLGYPMVKIPPTSAMGGYMND